MEEQKGSHKLPPIQMAYVVEMMHECGWHRLTWQELEAWKSATGTPLNTWEANAMMSMSNAYSTSVILSDEKEVPPPWHDGKVDRDKVERSVREALGGKHGGHRGTGLQGR